MRIPAMAFLVAATWTGAAPAQVPQKMLAEGDLLPGGQAGETVEGLFQVLNTAAGGYSVRVSTSVEGVLWGNPNDPAIGTVLRRPQDIGSYHQKSLVADHGMTSSGSTCYQALIDDLQSGERDLLSIWLDDAPIAISGRAVPNVSGVYWHNLLSAMVSDSGVPYWYATFTNANVDWIADGIFAGTDPTPLLLGGQMVPDIPFPLRELQNSREKFRHSSDASHWILPVDLKTRGDASIDKAIVVDGRGLIVAGTLVQEGNVVPPSAGGLNGETYSSFSSTSINRMGQWALTGFTSDDAILMVDGTIRHRNGDIVDGQELQRSATRATINDQGDVIYAWRAIEGATESMTFFVNDDVLIKDGDHVDIDGDGYADESAFIRRLQWSQVDSMSNRDQDDYVTLSTDLRFNLNGDNRRGILVTRVYVGQFRLNARPFLARTGDTMQVKMRGGTPGSPLAYFVTGVNGAPTFSLLQVSAFDSNGEDQLRGQVPPNLDGLNIAIRAYAINPGGKLEASNPAKVSLR